MFLVPAHSNPYFTLSLILYERNVFLQVDDTEVVNFLLQTEIIPLCLRIMETGSELSKTVATFIVQKMLLDEMGLTYVCATAERFYAVSICIALRARTYVFIESNIKTEGSDRSLTMILILSVQ
jgi:hypothetical protein